MITRSVWLPVAPAAAFELFTARAGEWWPPDRRHLGDPRSAILFLPDGRFYERATDGRELDLGRVRVWERPHRLVLDFFVGTDAAHPTEVEIRIVAERDGARVEVEHRAIPASAQLWDERAPRYMRSWDLVLAALSGAAYRNGGVTEP